MKRWLAYPWVLVLPAMLLWAQWGDVNAPTGSLGRWVGVSCVIALVVALVWQIASIVAYADERTKVRSAVRRVLARPQGDTVRVSLIGGTEDEREIGRFPPDDDEGITSAVATAEAEAEAYNERVRAARQHADRINRRAA